jgi:hypothetical protein
MYRAKPYSFIPRQLYYDNQIKLCNHLLDNSNTLVLCLADSPEIIFSYLIYQLVGDKIVIHWVATKYGYQRYGYASQLLSTVSPMWKDNLIIFTHMSKLFTFYKTKYNLIYDPYQGTNE